MRITAAVVFVAVSLGGCSDATSSEPIDVSGLWAYTEATGVASIGFSCSNSGTLVVAQQGRTLTGTYSHQGNCTVGSTVVDNSGSGLIVSGEVDGGTVRLEHGDCSYTGTISGPLANRLYGTMSCAVVVDDQQHTATGSWEALR
ncbi:MAG: hypothetical protein WEF86_00730 [Gemmatimonadota bacterium]